MFKRHRHQVIHQLLQGFNAPILEQAECFFGGGTAIVLLLDEYRESVDIDFLCASKEGFRLLRETVQTNSLGALLSTPIMAPTPLVYLREVRADMYGIRTFVEWEGVRVKIEIISEGRIELDGAFDAALGVNTLCRQDMYAEKVLAISDRGLDKSTFGRDMIDLAMMIGRWGPLPQVALLKARAAYGKSIDKSLADSAARMSDTAYLGLCFDKMGMEKNLMAPVLKVLQSLANAP